MTIFIYYIVDVFVMKFFDNKGSKKAISLLITVFVVALLVFSGPASAVEIGVKNISPDDPEVGDSVTFQVYVDIETNERIPIQNLTLHLGDTTCTFDVDGNNLTTCSGLTIENVVKYDNYAEGALFGYGYGYNGSQYTTTDATFGTGYGYGYGYGYQYTGGTYEAELTYNVTWDTTGVSAGSYDVYLEAFAKNGEDEFTFSSKNNAETITVSAVTTTTTSTTTSVSSGGGGSISTIATSTVATTTIETTTTIAQEEKEIGNVAPDEEKKITFEASKELGIEEIDFKALNEIADGKITVKTIDLDKDICDGYKISIKAPGLRYKDLCLEKQNIGNEDVSDVKIKFKITKEWIKDNNIDTGTLAIYRFSNGKWNKLPTEITKEDSTYVYLEAESPGLSAFSIAAREVQKTTTTIAPEKPEEGMPWTTIFIIIIVLGILAGIFYGVEKR